MHRKTIKKVILIIHAYFGNFIFTFGIWGFYTTLVFFNILAAFVSDIFDVWYTFHLTLFGTFINITFSAFHFLV